MNCMKCGREISEPDVFCPECLRDMEKYPVEPGAVVLMPRRKETYYQKKAPKRNTPSAEEQLAVLRKRMALLILLLVMCIAAIVLMFKPTMHYIRDEHYEIGQNYNTVTPSTPSTSQK
jgi:hypothetical protein